MFSLLNTRAKTNHIDTAPLPVNELTTEYWNSYAICNLLRNSKYRNSRDKTEALVLKPA